MKNEPVNGGPPVKVPLLQSLWEDEGRRALAILVVFTAVCIMAALVMNLLYKPQARGAFAGLNDLGGNYERTLIPTGFLLALLSLLFFSIGGTYGHYTEVTFGGKSLLARQFFKKLSFYSIMLGAVLLLSGGVANSIASRF